MLSINQYLLTIKFSNNQQINNFLTSCRKQNSIAQNLQLTRFLKSTLNRLKLYNFMIAFKIFLISSLIVNIWSIVQWGDISKPQSSSTFQDHRIDINLGISEQNITFVCKLKSYGYFAIMYSQYMDKSDFSVVQIVNNTITVSDYYSQGGHLKPTPDTVDDVMMLGYETDGQTYVIAKWTRRLDTGDLYQDTRLIAGQQFKFTSAKRQGWLTFKSHKEDDLSFFSGVLTNNQQFQTDDEFEHDQSTALFHGIVLTITWCVLADIAIAVKYYYKFKYRTTVHGIIFTIIIITTVYQIIDMMNHHEQQQKQKISMAEAPKTLTWHHKIAQLLLYWVVAQGLFGCLNRYSQFSDKIQPNIVKLIRQLHRLSGFVLLSLARIQIFLGWIVCGSSFMPHLILIQTIIVAYKFISFKKQDSTPVSGNVGLVIKSKSQVLLNDNPEAYYEKGDYIVFDSQVYQITDQNFHPGGKQLGILTKGRQVDRFLYGVSPMQSHDLNITFAHPTASIHILSNLVYIFPQNPVYILQSKSFCVHSYVGLSENLAIFYFKSMGQRTIFESRYCDTVQHIGQFFRVRNSDVTRLYTCVLSMRKDNIKLLEKIYDSIGISRVIVESNLEVMLQGSGQLQQIQSESHKEQHIPLIIKKYQNGVFTNKFYLNKMTPIMIEGLKGRGLGIEYAPPGNIILIAGGTGLFPFLDLLDIIFKTVINAESPIGEINEDTLNSYCEYLKNKSFILFLSVRFIAQMIIPTQLNYLSQKKHSLFKMVLRLTGQDSSLSPFKPITTTSRFDYQLFKNHLDSESISRVYICGPKRLYIQTTQQLSLLGVQSDKIHYV